MSSTSQLKKQYKKTPPPLLSGGEMDSKFVLRISRKRNVNAILRTARNILEKYQRVDLRAMGGAVSFVVKLANQLVNESHGTLQSHVRTYSVPVNIQLPSCHIEIDGTSNKKQSVDASSPASSSSSSSSTTSSISEATETKSNAPKNEIKYNSALSIIVFSGDL
jgi:hypothetical protein